MRSTQITKFPRKYNPFLNTIDLPMSKITGNPEQDGLQKYEIDFFETADWTVKCLNFVRDYTVPCQTKFEIPSKSMCFQTTEEYIYDYTIPQPLNNSAILLVKVDELTVSDSVKDAIKLICGKYYNPNSDLLSINSKDTIDCPPQETCTVNDNINHLSQMFSKLIETASKDEFKDLKFHNSGNKMKNLEFPKEWLKS